MSTTDGYVDALQIDAGTVDGDSRVYSTMVKTRRAEQMTTPSALRVEKTP